MEHEGKLVSTWEMMHKDADSNAVITELHKYEYDSVPVDERQFLSQAPPTIINSYEIAPRRSKDLLLADIPDIHYGLRRLPDGTLLPTHRPEVMDGFLQVMKDKQPNLIIIGGDSLDLPEISKYDADSRHFVDTLQLSIDGLHNYLSMLRADNPNAEIVALGGNHDEVRFNKFMIRNAMPLFGVKPANMPESFAVNSFPFLLRLEELGIDWVSGYPANSYKINDRLQTVHGEFANKTSTAAMYIARYAISTMFHHDHRRGYERRVFPDGKALEAFSFGCQADVTGSVPSTHNGVDAMGYPTTKYEQWDNGGGFVEYRKGDSPFRIHSVPIEAQDGYETKFNGKLYKPRPEVIEALRNGK